MCIYIYIYIDTHMYINMLSCLGPLMGLGGHLGGPGPSLGQSEASLGPRLLPQTALSSVHSFVALALIYRVEASMFF